MAHTLEELRAMRSGQVVTPTSAPRIPTTTSKITPQVQPQVNQTGDLGRGKYMTGSKLSKFFDVLSTPQYASAGLADSLVKGQNIFKGMKEGIQNRQSYSDVLGDAGVTNKYVKAIGGFAGDVLLDPTTYIGAGAIKTGLKKVPILAKGINKIDDVMRIENLVKKAPILQKVGGLISNKWRTGGNVDYLDLFNKTKVGIAEGQDKAIKLARDIKYAPEDFQFGKTLIKKGQELSPSIQRRINQIIEGGAVTENPFLKKITSPVKEALGETGKGMQEVGLLPKGILKYQDKYLPGYRKLDTAGSGISGALKVKLGRSKGKMSIEDWGQAYVDYKGIDLSKLSDFEKNRRLGIYGKQLKSEYMVGDNAYRAGRGIAEETSNIKVTDFFNKVSKRWAKDVEEKGFKQIPDSESYGKLAGKFVPDYIHQDIVGMGGLRPGDGGLLEKTLKKYDEALSVWKAGKTVLSPSQQVRNTLSNQILNYMVGGPGATAKLPSAIKKYLEKGDAYQEAKKSGLFAGGFNRNEISKFLPSGSTDGVLRKSLEKIKSGWNKAVEVGGGMQNANEEIAKLQQFIFQRSKGKTVDEAKALAEKALFNYSDLTPVEKNVLKRIIPFYTFGRKSIPLIAETAVKHPARLSLFKKGETAVNNMTPERSGEKKMLPSYLKDATRIPGTKNKYFNPQYIYPWGGVMGESDIPFGMNIPAYDMAAKMISGYDPYYKQSLTESPLKSDMTKAKADAVLRTLAPAAIAKNIPRPESSTSNKSLTNNLLSQVGLNVYDLDIGKATSQQQYQIKELQSKTSQYIKKAATGITNPDARNRRIKKLQENFQKEVQKILNGE